jgi:hypothetical protein
VKEKTVVGTFIARRAQQLMSDDPVLEAAGKITDLYGRLSMSLTAEQVFTAVALSFRAMRTVLVGAVGADAAEDIVNRAVWSATRAYKISDEATPDITVFDGQEPEGIGEKKGDED